MVRRPRVGAAGTGGRTPGAGEGRRPHQRAEAITILLVGGERLFVEALGILLDAEPGFRVVGAVAQAEEAVRLLRSHPVDVAVVPVGGAGLRGVEVGSALLAQRPQLTLVAVAETDDVPVLVAAVRAGFRAWVPKAAGLAALVEVLPAVYRGETRIPPELLTPLLAHLLNEHDDKRAAEASLAQLTSREREVLEALVRGGTREEIADELAISVNTVRTHLRNVLAKLGVHTSLAAVVVARRAGIS